MPALAGCLTWGETIEDAVANAREAIAGHVAALRDLGEPVPTDDDHAAGPIVFPLDVDPAA